MAVISSECDGKYTHTNLTIKANVHVKEPEEERIVVAKIKYNIQPISKTNASEVVKQAYDQMSHDMSGVHEPFLIHTPSEEIFLGLWSVYRESLLAKGRVSRALKEAITVTISDLNKCPWCYEAHTISLYAVGASQTVQALTQPDKINIVDAKTAALIEWARATRIPAASILQDPPFDRTEAPEIIGTTVVYHYMTKIVNALLIESPLPSQIWVKKVLQRVLGLIFVPFANRSILSGETLDFLPDAPLPPAFGWAKDSQSIAGAFARFAHVMECTAEKKIPQAVRECVINYVMVWQGEDPGMSRNWVEKVIKPLDSDSQPIARLALLGAIAPHQIDDGIINSFRKVCPDDEQLITVLGWANYIAAGRVSSWLYPTHWQV